MHDYYKNSFGDVFINGTYLRSCKSLTETYLSAEIYKSDFYERKVYYYPFVIDNLRLVCRNLQ